MTMFLLVEGRGNDKAMSAFHDLKLLLKRHDNSMMGEAIRMDEIFEEISGLPLTVQIEFNPRKLLPNFRHRFENVFDAITMKMRKKTADKA